jgi:hypothetical protein
MPWIAVFLVGAWLCVLAAERKGAAAEPAPRVGVYDSRAIAYAAFSSESHQKTIRERTAAAREAKAAGDTARSSELEQALQDEQRRIHLQVFSTAPVNEWLLGLTNEVRRVEQERRVSRLVSKWDAPALKGVPRRHRVDVTDALLESFTLTEKQQKTLSELRSKKPLPLAKAHARH